MVIDITPNTKSATFQKVKDILTVCGKTAHQYDIPFFKLIHVITYVLRYYNCEAEGLGKDFIEIFKAINNPDCDWFYDSWVPVDKTDKNPLEVMSEVAWFTMKDTYIDYQDASTMMVEPDQGELCRIILKYYQEVYTRADQAVVNQ